MTDKQTKRRWKKEIREVIEAQRELNGRTHQLLREVQPPTSQWLHLSNATYLTVDHLLILQQVIEEESSNGDR